MARGKQNTRARANRCASSLTAKAAQNTSSQTRSHAPGRFDRTTHGVVSAVCARDLARGFDDAASMAAVNPAVARFARG